MISFSSLVMLTAGVLTLAVRPVLAQGGGCQPTWLQFGPSGTGLNDSVSALSVYDDGGGPELYVGGEFTTAGTATANHIAKWNGTSWRPLGTGMDGGITTVSAMLAHDDGNGQALYVGGQFSSAGGVAANAIARWNGSSWGPVGVGMGGVPGPGVYSLAEHDDGSGLALYAGGYFTIPAGYLARWDGTSWSSVGIGPNWPVMALAAHDDGGGPALYAAGWFAMAGGMTVNRIARWDGSSWSSLGTGMTGPAVFALAVFDDGTGPALYAGGEFSAAGGAAANGIAKWDGFQWQSLDSGVNGRVDSLQVYDDGSGPALYVGGEFTTAGGWPANRIAKWDGASWSALGSGMSTWVFAMAVYDHGSGPFLFAGGTSTDTGDAFLAKWGGCSPVSPEIYCTGKTTSASCVPFISFNGTPSATSGPFNILSSDHVEGQIGIYLYSLQKANLNFHGGKLCVKAPFQRLTSLIKATDGVPCTGCAGSCRMFKRNFNALIQSGADPMLTPGQSVKVQVRQRDPGDPTGFGDNLSNAISFVIGA